MATIVPQAADSLEKLFADAGSAATAPLWTMMQAMVPPSPAPKAVPHLWRWDELRPLLDRAGTLISADQAERRVFMLVNPALRPPYTTDTLFGGMQMILPGETAPAHRHTAFALRFIVEGERGFTAVGGEKVTMERGDVILTPSWEFHDHGHEGSGPMIWLDGLDLPIWQAIPVNFAEPYAEPRYPSKPAEGRSRLKFPWSEIRAKLDGSTSSFYSVEYEQRERRAPISRIVGASAERIAAGTESPRRRETSSAVYHVVEGSGSTTVGEVELQWTRGDTFAVPAWMPYVHRPRGDEAAYLFRYDDRPVLRALGAYRAQLLFPEADLREHAPRAASVELGGLVFLARTIDKAKAKLQGTLGPYKIGPGLSAYLLEWLRIDEDAFTDAVRELREDDAIAAWVRAHSDPSTYPEIGEKLRTRGIRDAAHRADVATRYEWLGDRPDLKNWFEILDIDDALTFVR